MVEYLRKVDHATSVKQIMVVEEPTRTQPGVSDFKYRPVFSVFDYGTIEPSVPLDNSTVNLMMGFNFELLRREGVKSHYIGLVTDDGRLVSAEQAIHDNVAPTTARLRFVNRVMPEFREGEEYDYSMFGGSQSQCYVQPIEFISRNGLPKESSVWKRVAKGQVSLTDLGLPADFKQGDEVPASLKPILDYSTKFEKGDRYLSPEQTRQLMGISQERFDGINGTTRKASNIMTDYAAARGFVRADGKVEYVTFLAKQGDLWVPVDVLGDAVCTWHEDRLLFNGFPVSKQPIRDKVKKLNPEWYAAIEAAKDRAEKEHVKDFRTLIDPSIKYVSPSPEFFEGINQLFRAGTNQWVASRVYDVYPGKKESLEDSLARAIEEFQKVA